MLLISKTIRWLLRSLGLQHHLLLPWLVAVLLAQHLARGSGHLVVHRIGVLRLLLPVLVVVRLVPTLVHMPGQGECLARLHAALLHPLDRAFPARWRRLDDGARLVDRLALRKQTL